ncbi:MAG TPA: TolC family protein, partial [Saprospiraceae bacterium]|nr:TolC family protein [Saprospiraceae bacterium]
QAIDYAMQNSPQIKMSQNDIEDARQQIIERRSAGIPQLNGEISYNHYLVLPVTILPEEFAKDANGNINPDFNREVKFGVTNNLSGSLSLSALLFDGSYTVGLRAARTFKDYVQKQMASKQFDVKNQVIMAYLPALIVDVSLQTLDKNIANLKKLGADVKSTFEAGFAEQLDVDRLDLSLANLQVEKENLLRQKEIALNYLKFTISYPVEKDIEISDDINALLKDTPDADLAAPINYSSRPEYAVLNTGQQLNELNIKLYQAGYLPSAAAFGSYLYSIQGDNLFASDANLSPTAVIGAKISVPIFDGFNKKAKIQRARIQLNNFLEQKKLFERSVDLEVSNARKSYKSSSNRVASQKKNLELADKIYKTTQEKYKQGIGSSIEITQAEQSLYTSQQNYNQALYDLLVAKTTLDKSLGK